MTPKYIHWFLLVMFLAGAAVTGFGHDGEAIGVCIIVLALLVYLMIPRRRR